MTGFINWSKWCGPSWRTGLCHWMVMCSSQSGPYWRISLTKQHFHVPDHCLCTLWKTPTQMNDISVPLISISLPSFFLHVLFPLSLYLLAVHCVCECELWCTRPCWILRDIEIAAEKMKRPSCVFHDILGGHLSRLKFADTNARSAAVCQGSPPQLWIIIGVFFFFFYSFSFQLCACRKRDGFDPCGSWDAEQDQRRSLLAYGEARRLRGSLRYS